jgi:sporulation protein YlmC with PRC-barrel domain
MAIKVSSISETYGKDVFTNKGMFCGKIEDVECDLKRFKIRSLVVKAARESYISKMLGSKKGVIIPFPMVESIGDIIIIKHISLPVSEEEGEAVGPAERPEATPM